MRSGCSAFGVLCMCYDRSQYCSRSMEAGNASMRIAGAYVDEQIVEKVWSSLKVPKNIKTDYRRYAHHARGL